MADAKISALPSATTPLAGTEVLPVVQGGTTDKVSVDDLTLGRFVSANGMAFPATQVPSANANTLDDYEEGTWTPVYGGSSSNPTCTYDAQFGFYTKVGRVVTCTVLLRTTAASGGSGFLTLTGLPFTSANVASGIDGGPGSGSVYLSSGFGANFPQEIGIQPNSTFGYFSYRAGNAASANTSVTNLANTNPGNVLRTTFSYIV